MCRQERACRSSRRQRRAPRHSNSRPARRPLVHEKFDSQKVFDLMGRSIVTNPTVAKAYAETVASRLTDRFGDVTVSDAEERTRLAKLVSVATDYYDAIDGALAGANPASQPTNAPSTATPPSTSAPSKPSTK
jgi:hypothetical protein